MILRSSTITGTRGHTLYFREIKIHPSPPCKMLCKPVHYEVSEVGSFISSRLPESPLQVFTLPCEAAALLASLSRKHMDGPIGRSSRRKHLAIKGSLVWHFTILQLVYSSSFLFFLTVKSIQKLRYLEFKII